MLDQQARETFLNLFDPRRRAFVSGKFLDAVRNGKDTPTAVYFAVRTYCAARLSRNYSPQDVQKIDALLTIPRDHKEEAVGFANYCLQWEQMPDEARAAVKQERAQEGVRHWMQGQPATGRQVDYLRRLGYQGEVSDRAEASDLIDRLLSGGRSE